MSQMLFSLSNLVVGGSFTKTVPSADEPLPFVLECVNGTKHLHVSPTRLILWGSMGWFWVGARKHLYLQN